MKQFIFTLLLCTFLTLSSKAQEKFVTRTGSASFLSETPIEKIYAENNQVASILLTTKKVIAFNVLLKSFRFDKALMEEHFNEKYVHSETYPSAKFKGQLDLYIDPSITAIYKNIEIKGEMVFHGVKKPLTVIANVNVTDDAIIFTSDFKLKLEDYKVEILSLVKDKISEYVLIKIITNYKK
jgi:polyisoprenoid-binding protein YceI